MLQVSGTAVPISYYQPRGRDASAKLCLKQSVPLLCFPASDSTQAYLESDKELAKEHCISSTIPVVYSNSVLMVCCRPILRVTTSWPRSNAPPCALLLLIPLLVVTSIPFVCPIQAYLESDEELIKEHCSPEMIERLTGIMRVQKQQVGVVLRACSI